MRWLLSLLLVPLFALGGCATLPQEEFVDLWKNPQSHWQQEVEGLNVAFRIIPEAPDESQEAQLEILLMDKRLPSDPKPLLGADIKGTASMTRIPGHVHTLALTELHREKEPGRYGMHVKFGMGGEWLAVFIIRSADQKEWRVEIPFMVSGSRVPPWERKH